MGFPISLSQEYYEALIALARLGAQTPDTNRTLDSFLRQIEQTNGIQRSILWIQWQEKNTPLPPQTAFPDVWPPELRYYLELVTRPITYQDVQEALKKKASQPINVLVTSDPGAQLGWTKLDDYFTQK